MFSVLAVTNDPTFGSLLKAGFSDTNHPFELVPDGQAAQATLAARSWNCLLVDRTLAAAAYTSPRPWWQESTESGCCLVLLERIAPLPITPSVDGVATEAILFPELGFPYLLANLQLLWDRKQFQDDLREMEKLALIGTVSAGVLHELKNPLNNVLGGMDRVLELVADLPAVHRWAALIRRNGELLRESLTDLLGGFREDEVLGLVDIHALLDRAAAYVLKGEVSHRQIALRKSYDKALPKVPGSAGHLLHLFLNLIVNARQAISGKRGTISLRTRLQAPENVVIVDVEDTGPGIAAEILTQLFATSRSTKVGGSGFGLVFCRKIVDRHRGTIAAENLPQGGARFRVCLPLRP